MDRVQITFSPRYLVVIAFTASVALKIVAAIVDISWYIIDAMLFGWYLAMQRPESLQRVSSTDCGWSNPLINLIFRVGRGSRHFTDEGLAPHR